MTFFIFMGIISIATGVLLIAMPETLRAINERASSLMANFEENLFTYRMGVGISLVITSLLFFFVAYYIYVKG